jgi:hypothetical protein
MADVDLPEVDHTVPTIPVAPRMKGTDGRPKPHIGPTIDDYKKIWSKTVGTGSDEFWRKVCLFDPASRSHLTLETALSERSNTRAIDGI